MPMNYDDGEVSFDIVEHIGVLATYSTGWAKEINLVSWNGGPARYDLRDWAPNHTRMSKGVTFEEKEMRALIDSFRKRRTAGMRSMRDAAEEQEPKEEEALCAEEMTGTEQTETESF